MPITTIPTEAFEDPRYKEIVALAEKALRCKECDGQIHIFTDHDDPPLGLKWFITAHCAKKHFREVGWYTDPKDMKAVLKDLINKWNEANAKQTECHF